MIIREEQQQEEECHSEFARWLRQNKTTHTHARLLRVTINAFAADDDVHKF
jgi:hypothetical protein